MLQAIKGVILILAIGCIAGVRCMDYDRCYEGLAEGEFFAHPEDCSWFFYCIEGDLEPGNCPDNTLFNPVEKFCDEPHLVECITDPFPEEEVDEEECPNTFGVSFIRSQTNCEEYYICFNGNPTLAKCKQGLHWNQEKGYCGNPRLANCQINVPAQPSRCLVEDGTFPHPWNCNWFIYCQNGNETTQQCPHLLQFDADQNRCIFKSDAHCLTRILT